MHGVPSAVQALMSSIAATLRRLIEAVSDLVSLDLSRRVAKVLLTQPRGNDGTIRPALSQEEFAHQAAGTLQSVDAACAVHSDGDGLRCMTGP